MNYAVIFNSIQLYVQKRLFEQTLSLYVSPKLVKRFAADPEMCRDRGIHVSAQDTSSTRFTARAVITARLSHLMLSSLNEISACDSVRPSPRY